MKARVGECNLCSHKAATLSAILDLLPRFGRARGLAEVDPYQVLPQRVRFGYTLKLAQRDLVRVLAMGAQVKCKSTPRLLEHALRGLAHGEEQASSCLGLLAQAKLLLLDGDQALAVAGFAK